MLKASVPRKGVSAEAAFASAVDDLVDRTACEEAALDREGDRHDEPRRALQQLVEPVMGEVGKTTIERKLDRAVRRRTAHQQAAIACRAPGGLGSFGSAWQSFLETNRVREPTARRYKQEVDDLREHFPKLALETLAPESLDECVVEYLEHL